MQRETMTSRQRWEAVLRHEVPDRMPMDYWGTPEAGAKLVEHMGCPDLAEALQRLHVDMPLPVRPRYTGPPLPPGTDVHGCRHQRVEYDGGAYSECVFHPLAQYETVDEIEAAYTWPSVDWYDFSGIPDQVAGQEHRPIRGGGSEPFLLYKSLRGQEQAFMDLVLNPEIVDYCLDRMFGFCYETTRRIFEQAGGQVLISYVAEDLGGQTALMMSREHIARFLAPRMKRMIDLVHEAGAYAFFHSDGAVLDVVPDMIEIGIDVLNPIQWRCAGMDREVLKARFGDQVVLHGGVDNQQTLAFGSVEDVKEEVAHNIRVMGEGGGYILAPCHNIQSVSPPENVVALYETAYGMGWY